MKKVEAIVSPARLETVREALLARGVPALSLTEVHGISHEPMATGYYRGTRYDVDLHPKLKLEIVVRDEDAIPVAYAIMDAARTGRVGDGKVMLYPVDDAVRIRTGEHGVAAIHDGVGSLGEPPGQGRLVALG